MSAPAARRRDPDRDPGLQPERTRLARRRTTPPGTALTVRAEYEQ
ncbi:hypothetical protein [Streptomyces variegatus]